jgi:ABC-type uncharacterized transport system ATPase subunit
LATQLDQLFRTHVNKKENAIIINTQTQLKQPTQDVLKYRQPMLIELHELCKKYRTKCAVSNINLSVFGGEVFGFLGPNGVGKTTTIKMIVGLLQPSAGTVKVGGYDIVRRPI